MVLSCVGLATFPVLPPRISPDVVAFNAVLGACEAWKADDVTPFPPHDRAFLAV